MRPIGVPGRRRLMIAAALWLAIVTAGQPAAGQDEVRRLLHSSAAAARALVHRAGAGRDAGPARRSPGSRGDALLLDHLVTALHEGVALDQRAARGVEGPGTHCAPRQHEGESRDRPARRDDPALHRAGGLGRGWRGRRRLPGDRDTHRVSSGSAAAHRRTSDRPPGLGEPGRASPPRRRPFILDWPSSGAEAPCSSRRGSRVNQSR